MPGLTEFSVQSVEDINKVRHGAGSHPTVHCWLCGIVPGWGGWNRAHNRPWVCCRGSEIKARGPGGCWDGRIAVSPPPHPQVFEFGHVNRVTECTNLNEHSSRSHALLIVTVRGLDRSTGLRTTGGCSAPGGAAGRRWRC